jgi:hypothetical protein
MHDPSKAHEIRVVQRFQVATQGVRRESETNAKLAGRERLFFSERDEQLGAKSGESR